MIETGNYKKVFCYEVITVQKIFWKIKIEQIKQKALSWTRQGMTAEKLALTLTLGLVAGIFPIWGISTIFCLFIAFALRLNLGAIQFVNYIATPLQLILIYPLYQAGSMVIGAEHLPVPVFVFHNFLENWAKNLSTLSHSFLYATTGWLLFSLPLAFVLYYVLIFMFKKIASFKTQSP